MTQKGPNHDTTIEDIHRERQRMADKFGGDIMAILEDARQRQTAAGRPVWHAPSPHTLLPPAGTVSETSGNQTASAGVSS